MDDMKKRVAAHGRLRWLLFAAIVLSPVAVDLRHGFTWSEASAQYLNYYLNCDPIVLKYYRFSQYIGQQVTFRSPPPNCVRPTCVRWGACVSALRLNYGLPAQCKLDPNGCLLRICTATPIVPWFGR